MVRPWQEMIVRSVGLVALAALVCGCPEKQAPSAQPPTNGAKPSAGDAQPPADDDRPHPDAARAGAACHSKEKTMGDRMTFRETTNPTLSDHNVGIGNIWERELPDGEGVVGKRMSAILSIHDPATDEERRETVVTGSVLELGADRYCVVEIEEGSNAPGTITFEKLKP